MKAVIPAIIALAAAPAAAEDAMVIIRFDPVDNHVTIDFPTTQSNQLDGATPPDWLTLASDTQHPVLTGTLPALARDARGLGASETGAYLFDPLAWLPEPFASAHQSVRIETPVPFRGVGAGELLSETHSDGLYTATFRVDRSLAEADVFFGPYEISENLLELPGGTVRLRTYFLAKDQAYAEAYLDASARYITRYSQDVGHYPNAGFAVVSAPIPVGYAFDGLTYISEAILAHPYMLGRSLAHEILHNWWGSGVRVDYSAGNWAEGLTTYLADHALAEDHDPAEVLPKVEAEHVGQPVDHLVDFRPLGLVEVSHDFARQGAAADLAGVQHHAPRRVGRGQIVGGIVGGGRDGQERDRGQGHGSDQGGEKAFHVRIQS